MPRTQGKSSLLKLTLLAASLISSAFALAPGGADSARTLTTADYAHAEKFMNYNTTPLVLHAVRPQWLPDERIWFRDTTAEGSEFVVFNPVGAKREPAFDHAKIAAALSAAAGKSFDANHLPFQQFEYSADGKSITFN